MIVAYFAVATFWAPSFVLELGFVAEGSSLVADLVATGVWTISLVLGIVGLRAAQRRGLI